MDAQDNVRRLVLSIGQADFHNRFSHECDLLYRADQITAFVVEDRAVRCVIAHRPQQPERVQRLVHAYARRFVPRDALLGAARRDRAQFTAAPLDCADITDTAYRHRLFEEAGLQSKIALYSHHDERELYVNFYFRKPLANDKTLKSMREYGQILVACLHKHEALSGGGFQAGTMRGRVRRYLTERFPTLSPRESEVVAAICCGFSTEAISLDLGIARSSVITLRRRAYAKMRINGRAELFAAISGLTFS